ncbi:glycosyltransferase family 4 protein [Blastomonas fulva]|jgi:glycosyltransferase involved in cell wall biosynthesis|uniref:glycosyltransferase family 4 protein n=1 Tax=Blastomonas fulva TaxID=1550728 RepID=UPI003D2D6696
MISVLSLYATDFGGLSAGGIRTVIGMISQGRPRNVSITHLGLGPQNGPLPAAEDSYIALGEAQPVGERSGVNAQYLRRLSKLPKDTFSRYDLVLCHRAEHMAVIPRGVPVALYLHGGSWGMFRASRSAAGLVYPFIELYAAMRAKVTLSVSPDSHNSLFRALVTPHFQPACYDDSTFFAADERWTPLQSKVIASVARLVPEKRLHLIIQAAKHLDAEAVHIFGDGPERGALSALANELGVNLVLHGHVTGRQISDWYRSNPCVFAMSSLFEGFPVAALEASACSIPVVALAAPGISVAIPMMGGYVAQTLDQFADLIERAGAEGPKMAPETIAETFGTEAFAHRFWDLALNSLQ